MQLTHVPDDPLADPEFTEVKGRMVGHVQDHMNTHLDADLFNTIPVLKAMANLFDPTSWPRDQADLATYGNQDLQVVMGHFAPLLQRLNHQQADIMREWTGLKSLRCEQTAAGGEARSCSC